MKDSKNSGKTTPEFTPRRIALAAASVIGQLKQGMVLFSCGYENDPYSRFEVLAGLGSVDSFVVPAGAFQAGHLKKLRKFLGGPPGWVFCCIGYDVKNGMEKLSSKNPDRIGFPDLVFFRPAAVVGQRMGTFFTSGDNGVLSAFMQAVQQHHENSENLPVQVHNAITEARYLEAVGKAKAYIQQGDIYEMNFCQEFFAETPEDFSPEQFWQSLTEASPAPFSVFCRWHSHYLASASPERFLQKDCNRLISQPMKGTIGRGKGKKEDLLMRQRLLASEKERSENVMITDLVRNDLSRVSEPGTVSVDELFGVYTFPQVHQMISTVSCRVRPEADFTDLLSATFPMGSMTGAPKIRAMQLIDELESSRRGLFSGATGYLSPEGDLDMNVIIRSVIGCNQRKILSFQTGGAITSDSVPEEEYRESMLKASAIIHLLNPGHKNP
ncbi:MAG TPA: anthranilate synthase component I family protein [Bacteroidales bacterium]|nr:anthranilate synthase component I family protein [Bacteroidales bacterium]HRZ48492.1 anthranilate synthase component I family protein [Bacteroidales bacterium]